MNTAEQEIRARGCRGQATLALAHVCHGCGICARADRKPQSAFGRLMRWHRGWCPAWAAHTLVYGRKNLS